MILIKNKIEEKVKNRLATTIGHDAAMKIYHQLIEYTTAVANRVEADKTLWRSEKTRQLIIS